MAKKTFYLFLVDDDNKIFSVEGPMSDDTGWIERVVKEKDKGRNVKCFTPSETYPLEYSIKSYIEQTGYRCSEDSVI